MTALLEDRPLVDSLSHPHEMFLCDHGRHSIMEWTLADHPAVAAARRAFTARVARGYLAYELLLPGVLVRMTEFDANAFRIAVVCAPDCVGSHADTT
jgi:hypothetical protein